MLAWVTKTLDSMGYAGVIFLMFLENVFPPIPSEVVMPLAGYTAARGEMSLWGVILAGTLGAVLGALPLYYLGHAMGKDRVRRFAHRHGRWLTLSADDIDKAVHWFGRYGGAAVFLCRLVPGVRSLISVPAGICGMKLAPFLLYTALGSAIWTAALAWLGHKLGANYHAVEKYLGPVTYVVFGALLLWFIIRAIRHRGAKENRDGEPPPPRPEFEQGSCRT